jgi:phosphocarrier protein
VSDTVEGVFRVENELGLHARPAGKFVALAARFESEISVGSADEWVDGRSVLSLLSLAAGRGTELRIRAAGPDAAAAVEALGILLERPRADDTATG